MDSYFSTRFFTLIPREFYTLQLGQEALQQQFNLPPDGNFQSCSVARYGAVAVYAVPENAPYDQLPLILRLLEESASIPDFNKVVFHYSPEKELSQVVICNGGELKYANAFVAESFESALYFLFLAIRKLHMNPKQCIIRVCSAIAPEQENTVARFFAGVQIRNLDAEAARETADKTIKES